MLKAKRKTVITSLVAMIGVLVGALSVSLTWFAKMNSIDDLEIGGSVLKQYFDSGTGTQTDPFVITRPKHWENLVWLHNNVSNFYQAITDEQVDPQQQNDQGYYFQVGKQIEGQGEYYVYDYTDEGLINPNNSSMNSRTLNLKGLGSLIPIGCDTKPFLGDINGHGICVSGFEVLGFEDINYNLQYDNGEVGFNDVGIFGYIGNDSSVHNIYFDDFTIHLANASKIRSNNATLHNDSFHASVENGAPDTCFAGYIAGHMHYSSSVESVYINNCTIDSGCAATVGFGYFGVVEQQNGKPQSTPLQEIQEIKQAGKENNYGGSLDFYTVYSRLAAIFATADDPSYYVDKQTLVVNDKTGNLTGETKDLNDPNRDSIYHHETQVGTYFNQTEVTYQYANYEDDYGGVYNFCSDNGLWQGNYYQCLFGESKCTTKTVTTYTFLDSTYECFLIQNGNNYLNHRYYPTVQPETDVNYAAGWRFTGNDTGNLYTMVFDTAYYLNCTDYSLTMSTSPSTNWTKTINNEIYTNINGTIYYLDFDGTWCVSPYADRYTINDGEGHYLLANNADIGLATTEANATKFFLTNVGGNGAIGYNYNNKIYYLTNDNENLSISTTATIWSKDGSYYYVTVQGIRYFLVYDGAWKLQPESGIRIGDGNDHYVTSTDNIEATNVALNDSVVWHFSEDTGDTQVYYIYNGLKRYLTHTINNELAISTTAFTWNRNGNNLYYTANGHTYFLVYYYGWRISDLEYYPICDNNGHYLFANGTNSFSNTDANGATHFYIDNNGLINYVYNGSIYYLNLNINNNVGTLQSSETSNNTFWQTSNNTIFYQDLSNGVTYYLEYNNDWIIRRYANAGYITDGYNYITVSGTSIGNTTDINSAALFIFGNSGNDPFTIQVLGTNNYLRNNNGTLQISTTSTSWSKEGNILYNGNYYLKCIEGSWQLSTSKVVGYYISRNNYYLNLDGNTIRTSTSSSTIWSGTEGSIKALNTNYYLNVSQTGSTGNYLTGSTTSRTWTKNNNNVLYFTNYESRYTYYYSIQLNNNAFRIYRNRSSLNTTNCALTFTEVNGVSRCVSLENNIINTIITKTEVPTPSLTYTQYSANKNGVSEYSYTKNYSLSYSTKQLQDCIGSSQSNVESGNPTYFPLRVDKDETTGQYASGWPASEKNTGYIISGANVEDTTTSDSSKKWGDIRISGFAISNINSSYSANSYADTYGFHDVKTVNNSGIKTLTTTEIKNDSNCLHAFSELKKAVSGDQNSHVYGVHFMDAAISTQHTIRAKNVRLLGNEYHNYELPQDAIDFHLSTRGNISFIAGDYFQNGTDINNTFFSLHRIFRDANNNITSIKEIEAMYAHSLRPNKTNYILKFKDGTYTNADNTYTGVTTRDSNYGSEPVFKTDWNTNPGFNTKGSNLYYFSMPANAGEYALGSVSGKTGAYLCYLDIAANGGDAVLEYMKDPVSINAFENVDFRSPSDVSPHCIIQIGAEYPQVNTNVTNLQVSVTFVSDPSTLPNGDDYKAYYPTGGGIYIIRVTNKTGQMFKLNVLLVDDDDNLYNDYTYAYRVIYTNEDHTDTVIDGTTLYDGLETDVDFWQRMAIFDIPSSGEAVEDDYKDE